MTARSKKSVIALLVDDIDENTAPGAFGYYTAQGGGDVIGLIYNCPCGCGIKGSLDFRPPAARPSWEWDGNRAYPTLAPSVHHLIAGKTHWHGHLVKGVWKEA